MALTLDEKKTLASIVERLDRLDAAIRGSDGEIGLVAKVEKIMEFERVCPVYSVSKTLWGNPEDGIKATGLVAKVMEHDKFIRNISKIYYAAVGTIVLTLINIVVSLLINNTN